MLTSEELFPPEYCFAWKLQSSHLARLFSTLSLVSSLSLSLSSLRPFSPPPPRPPPMPFVSFPTFPPSRFSSPLSRAPFAQRHCFNETGNVQFVRPAPGPWREEAPCALSRYVSSLSLGPPPCRPRKTSTALLVRDTAHSYAAASAPRRVAILTVCNIPRRVWRKIIFFPPGTRTRRAVHRRVLVTSLPTLLGIAK